MRGHVFSLHLWPVCFWHHDWWLCDTKHPGPNFQQSKSCFHIFDRAYSNFALWRRTVFPNPFGHVISSVHRIAVQKRLTRCCLSSGPTGLYHWTSWIRLLMAMLKFRGKCNKFVVLPCDSTITRHTAMGCGCHTAVSSFLRELHDISSWLRSFGTEVHHDGDQGFHHEAQAPRITPSGLSCSKTIFVGGITCQVILLGQSTRTF